MFANMASLNNWRRLRGFSEPPFSDRPTKPIFNHLPQIRSSSDLTAAKQATQTT